MSTCVRWRDVAFFDRSKYTYDSDTPRADSRAQYDYGDPYPAMLAEDAPVQSNDRELDEEEDAGVY